MRAFLGRYLPAGERRTALWLVLGNLVVLGVAYRLDRMIEREMSIVRGEVPVSLATIQFVQVLAEFAVVAWLVALLIRFARAPKALALYVLVSGLLGVVLVIVSQPVTMFTVARSSATGWATFGPIGQYLIGVVVGTLPSLAIGLGAVAGAWIAATVSLARIRDAGFSGDDSETHEGLRRKPEPIGWSFMGWEGRPLEGDALIAMALVAVTVIPSLASDVANFAAAFVPGVGAPGYSETPVFVVLLVVSALAWYASANLVTRRLGIVALWTVQAGALLGSAVYMMEFAASEPLFAPWGWVTAINLVPPLVAIAAALLGSAHALRSKPATLSASDQQDPGEGVPDDTAGGN